MTNLDNGQRVARKILGKDATMSLEELLSNWLLQERIICQRFKDDCKEKGHLADRLMVKIEMLEAGTKRIEGWLKENKILAGFRKRLRNLEAGLKGQSKAMDAALDLMADMQKILNQLTSEQKRRKQMRTVRLTWKARVNRRKRAAVLKWIQKFYATVKDHGDYVTLLAPNDDTKFIWIFMLSKSFKDVE